MMTCDNPECEKTSKDVRIRTYWTTFESNSGSYCIPDVDLCGDCADKLSEAIKKLVGAMLEEEGD